MTSYLVLDIENNNQSKLRKAGHFLYDPIVALGFKNSTELYSKYVYPDKLTQLQIDEDILVGFHLQHDLLFLWPLLQDFFKRGGRIWDCQLVEYLLSGQRNKFPSLRTTAVLYGQPQRDKLMEPFWKEGCQTSDIPNQLVLQDVEQDVLDTEAIYLQQKNKEIPLWNQYMDAELALCEMEYNGMYVNLSQLQNNKLILEKGLEIATNQLNTLVESFWR